MDQNLIDKNQNQEQNPSYTPNIDSSNSNAAFNSTQSIPTPEGPYYSSQSTNNAQQYPSQHSSIQPYPSQNMSTPQNQYYPSQEGIPIQSGDQINYYPLEPGTLNVQPNPPNKNNISYNPIQHKGIIHTKPDTFYITRDSGIKCSPGFIFTLGILIIFCSLLSDRTDHSEPIFFLVLGIFLIIISLMVFCTKDQNAFIILYSNSISITKRKSCYRKQFLYNLEDLERIDFIYERVDNKKNIYSFNVVRKNGEIDNILKYTSFTRILFTSEEIRYFLYIVNNHIKAKKIV